MQSAALSWVAAPAAPETDFPAIPSSGIARLFLSQFRCYQQLDLALTAQIVVLTGPNGAGKTNVLEALSLLAPGRGLRRAKLSAMDRRSVEALGQGGEPNGAGWAVAATVHHPDGPVEIGTGHMMPDDDAASRRVVKIQGVPQKSPTILSDYVSVLWLTPQMDGLFIEGASERRRFIDRAVYGLDSAHASRVLAYEQAARERLRLLRQGRADVAWLSGLERQMAEAGVAIAAARLEAAELLNAAMASSTDPFPRAFVGMEGQTEQWLSQMKAIEAEDRLAAEFARMRALDQASGQTSAGPQRSDLKVTHGTTGRPAADCSTGEQKSLLIALTLAQARMLKERKGWAPVMLLDEVAAHLDAERRVALFEALLALGGQVWLTGTDAPLFAPLRGKAQFLTVRDARIESEDRVV